MPKTFAFKLTAAQRQGLRDYWRIYAACHGEIAAELRRMAAKKPEIAVMLKISGGKEAEEGYEMLQSAVLDGAWQPYLTRLKEHGMEYARLGIGFEVWFEIISAYRRLILPHLLQAYGQAAGGTLA